jgi:pimeloyl-ACP methyl ester carboxylesterase
MRISILCLLLAFASAIYCAATAAQPLDGEEAITFAANSGAKTDAYSGSFEVPEYRGDPDSKPLTLRYVRFPSTAEKPGAPIVYLSGGPGGSGIATARWRRFPVFEAMRAHGDVIALDQRGTGDSDAPRECRSSLVVPTTDPVSDEAFAELHRRAVRECATFWSGNGSDLRGYTTAESVADLSALRRHLGTEQISLWGISYGSHLALAAIKAIPQELDRVIIASVEGLDQTVKLPARTDDYLQRLGESQGHEDLPGLMREVLKQLDSQPLAIELSIGDSPLPYLLQRRDLQMMTSALVADPAWATKAIEVYEGLHRGDVEPAQKMLSQFLEPGEPITLRAMPTAMDRASGISAARLAMVEKQARSAMLGAYLNFPMPQILTELKHLDLGDAFRANPVSDIPTLVLTGSLDGRTYPLSQREATAGLSNATHISVEGAGHNLFMASPRISEIMGKFLDGAAIGTTSVTVLPQN